MGLGLRNGATWSARRWGTDEGARVRYVGSHLPTQEPTRTGSTTGCWGCTGWLEIVRYNPQRTSKHQVTEAPIVVTITVDDTRRAPAFAPAMLPASRRVRWSLRRRQGLRLRLDG